MRFDMRTIRIGQRADLAPVDAMIFSRLKVIGADRAYHFPELGVPCYDGHPSSSIGREPGLAMRA